TEDFSREMESKLLPAARGHPEGVFRRSPSGNALTGVWSSLTASRNGSSYNPCMLPRNLRPIRLSRRLEPFDSDQFVFELKIDGFRSLAYIENGQCELVSRNGNTFRNSRSGPNGDLWPRFKGNAGPLQSCSIRGA